MKLYLCESYNIRQVERIRTGTLYKLGLEFLFI